MPGRSWFGGTDELKGFLKVHCATREDGSWDVSPTDVIMGLGELEVIIDAETTYREKKSGEERTIADDLLEAGLGVMVGAVF